jgi:hypothetical protein
MRIYARVRKTYQRVGYRKVNVVVKQKLNTEKVR